MNFFETSKFPDQKPSSIVCLLHGWGANGRDLLSIAEIWQDHMPNTLFICPEAPEICDANPHGFQWFGLGDWSSEEVANGAQKAHAALNEFIHKQVQVHEIELKNVALMGFSQGMMMALYSGLRQEKPLAGILGYSGALVGADQNLPVTYPKTKICLIHGQDDPVVPIQMHDMAVEWLQNYQYQVDSLKIPGLPHGIEQSGMTKGLTFLKQCLY